MCEPNDFLFNLRVFTFWFDRESIIPRNFGFAINQSIFYFMSVYIEVILDKNKKQKHIIIIYTNFPTGL